MIDTDVFVINLRYPRDSRYSENKAFLERIKREELTAWTTLYNLMEVCGVLSFNPSPQSLQELFIGFAAQFNVMILFPDGRKEEACFAPTEILETMKRKLGFGDALIAEVAQRQRGRIDLFVTWNAAHFGGKLSSKTVTPNQLRAGASEGGVSGLRIIGIS
ncbi:hypothetical protein M1M97_00640 [Thermodesulfovibrionales bacterium]|nr:hypothetical protein [Thermodesulfovibrionales bacterium]MCL0051172.1 hypothetical protein [Thermodesulfovibrionales bacterium]